MELNEVLRNIELFNGLSAEELPQLMAICREQEYQRGETIIQQGDPGSEIFIITQGTVEILVNDFKDPAVERVVANLGSGQIIGEMGLVDQGPRSATVRAVTDHTRLQSLSYQTLRALFDQNAHIGYLVMNNLAADISFKLRHANASAE